MTEHRTIAEHPMHTALQNWAAVMRADLAAEGPGEYPDEPPTSKGYVAPYQTDDCTDPPPCEDWAIRVQDSLNVMREYRPDLYRILYNHYRNHWTTAPHVVVWAMNTFGLYY